MAIIVPDAVGILALPAQAVAEGQGRGGCQVDTCTRALRASLLAASLALAACGGGGGGSAPASTSTSTSISTPSSGTTPPPANANQIQVTVEQNPDITSYITANSPYVDVKVCNAAGSCVTVHHVLVDTGSYGLRLFDSALGGVSLSPMLSVGATPEPVGECASFVSSALWGAVRMASVSIGGNTTTTQIPIQVVGEGCVPGGQECWEPPQQLQRKPSMAQ